MNGTETVQTATKSEYDLLENNFFIRRTSGKFIISSIISMVFLYIGSLIDTLLVGLYLGEDGLSAMSLVSPVYLVYYTVGACIGIGASIMASRVLGRGDTDEYRRVFTCATLAMGLAVLVMTAAAYILLDPITAALCGTVTGDRMTMVRDYLMLYIPGGGLTLMAYIPLYFLKTDGRPKVSSRLFSLSAVINVALSWLFMSPVFGMGTDGASLATSISMGTVAVLGFILMLGSHKTELRFVKHSISAERVRTVIVAGIPNGMSNLLESARILMINMLLIYTGAAALLSCYTVVRNVNDVLNSVIIGLSSALLPLIGVFFGERDYSSERKVMQLAMRIGLAVMIPLTVLVCLVPEPLFRLFGVTDPSLIAEGRWALPLSCIGLTAAYANTLYTGYLTAIGREGFATVLVVLRLLAVLAAFAFPLSLLFGSRGIWISLSLAEIITLAVFYIIRGCIRHRHRELDRLLLSPEKELAGDISFSVLNQVEDIVSASTKISAFCEDHSIDMKRSMRVSLAIEETLTFLIGHCLGADKENYVAVRVCKLDQEVMVRFRYVGEIFDPLSYFRENEENEQLMEELLGLKMIIRSASLVNFQQTLGTNNLLIIF